MDRTVGTGISNVYLHASSIWPCYLNKHTVVSRRIAGCAAYHASLPFAYGASFTFFLLVVDAGTTKVAELGTPPDDL